MSAVVGRQLGDLVRATVATLITLGVGWAAALLVPLYDFLVDDEQRYLPISYALAWTGIAAAGVAAAVMSFSKLRSRRPIGWTPLVAVPLVIESWLLGCLVALVLG
ncbi:hypothetical protein [Nocardia amikacinitolerans]|uniref:hypothetical protein n=1 Tax=Nocardia amikacinitolerans TaxID=756689 RepID=UPI0020A2B05C|nr:hypothetical protein [Nocardia amikacinitolerans]MCP2292225.1 hypothetical protein [Nocardia amikacinitolerans]